MPKNTRPAAEGSGIHAAGLTIHSQLGCLFRRQPENGFGVDAHVEIVEDEEPTGLLVGLQIKSGSAYLKEADPDGFVFRGKLRHLDYWINHSLPIIVVLHDPASDTCFWQSVSEHVVKRLKKGWKLVVPRAQKLDSASRDALAALTQATPYDQRVSALILTRPWMDFLKKPSNRVFLEAEEWIHKTGGWGSFRLILDNKKEKEVVHDWPFVMMGVEPYVELFQSLFPWADISIDQEFYYDIDYDLFEQECGMWDSEDKQYIGRLLTNGEPSSQA